MLFALQSSESNHGPARFKNFLNPSGSCIVKGIVFFGTPFRGSRIANWFEPLTRHLPLPLNVSFIERLKIVNANRKATIKLRAEDVSAIVDHFVSLTKSFNIPLIIFWEEKRVRRFGIPLIHVGITK
jgi:hypothetical protein